MIALSATIEDGRLHDVDVQPGFLHRGAEELFEVRDYRSLIMLADRHDWMSSFSGELVVTIAVESAMGLVPPPRATWLRTALAEFARVHSHLSFLSHLWGDDAADVWRLVDDLRDHLLTWSGNRVHPMLNRVGGLASDVPGGWFHDLAPLLARAEALADAVPARLLAAPHLHGLAVAGPAFCTDHALTGPVARAAGLDLDRRRNGHLAYADVHEPVPTRSAGDAAARFALLGDEVLASVTMLRRLADGVPAGDVATRLSRRLKVPEGEHTAEVEAPWGVAGVLLVSRGGQTPWRLALRTPTFANVAALGPLLEGVPEDRLADAVASIGYAIGDLDK